MSANCGPVNPLQKISNFQQIDRSLQFESQQTNRHNNSFRQNTFNHQLDLEFQQQFNPSIHNSFQGTQVIHNHPSYHKPLNHQQSTNKSWANDFAALSLNSPQKQQNGRQQTNDWSSQFRVSSQPTQISHNVQQNQFQNRFNQVHSNYTRNQVVSNQQFIPQQQHRTEHQEIHQREFEFFEELDKEFDSLAQNQLVKERVVEQELPFPSQNNEGFQKAAQTITSVMEEKAKSDTNDKFAQSDFLKLMQMVSNGKVSLNNDETRLVDQQGKDIHEEKLDSNGISKEKVNTLPNPLEGLSSNDLNSPYESSQKVGQLHGEKYSWDDVYADYRNDDDDF